MTPKQLDALTALAGRELTGSEIAEMEPLLAIRNDVALAAKLSPGRTRYTQTQIGTGTVMAVLGKRGGKFLNAVETLSKIDADVYWGFDPVRRGVMDMSIPEARNQLILLKTKMPEEHSADIDRIMLVGLVPDPIHFNEVSNKLNIAEGRVQL